MKFLIRLVFFIIIYICSFLQSLFAFNGIDFNNNFIQDNTYLGYIDSNRFTFNEINFNGGFVSEELMNIAINKSRFQALNISNFGEDSFLRKLMKNVDDGLLLGNIRVLYTKTYLTLLEASNNGQYEYTGQTGIVDLFENVNYFKIIEFPKQGNVTFTEGFFNNTNHVLMKIKNKFIGLY